MEKGAGWKYNPAGHLTKTLLLLKHQHTSMGNNVPQIHTSLHRKQSRNSKESMCLVPLLKRCHVSKQRPNGPVLTSTLNGCSSPFTAHKIHSNNCKHSVPIQQLLRHLLLRTANKTIVNPAVVAYCLCSVWFTVDRKNNGGDKSYTFSSNIADVSRCLCESRAEGKEKGGKKEREGFVDRRGSPRGESVAC